MINQPSLKYVLIGNINLKKIMGDYPPKSSERYAKEARMIFENMAGESKITYEERNRIDDQLHNAHYYFTTALAGVFFLVYVDNEYPDYLINQFFDEIQKEGFNLLTDEKGELTKTAKEKLRALAERFRMTKNANSISAAKAEIEQVQIEMKKNVGNLVSNLEDIHVLEAKSNKLQEGADLMRRDAKDLESTTWWRNVKFTIIIIVVIVAILLIIILPLTIKSGGDEKPANVTNTTNIIQNGTRANRTKLAF